MSDEGDRDQKSTLALRKTLSVFSYVSFESPRRSSRNPALVNTRTKNADVKEEEPRDDLAAVTPRKRRQAVDDEEGLNDLEPEDPTPSPVKKARKSPSKKSPKPRRGYAPPETYAHLNLLQDHLDYDLDIVFCGINPGKMSATKGHHFANPTNHFWKCLHRSGLTTELVPPEQDFTLPERFSLGLTNLVERPSSSESELYVTEMADSIPAFLAKITKYRPKILCIVGVGIWRVIEKNIKNNSLKGIRLELPKMNGGDASKASPKGKKKVKDDDLALRPCVLVYHSEKEIESRTLIFVSPSTSGLVTSHQLPDKVVIFSSLRDVLIKCKCGEIDMAPMTKVYIDRSTLVQKSLEFEGVKMER
ncbi:DNA glycosylase [Sistotremastrum suecicum HHB10207 ss-3]|uniref:DNA glycosylase n=1 Tax=Sistotremastrum suecicum HHB10207 ss-3 TaxID=1314776 RepID=A0A166CVP4_9AGAM|nr:DNA glycosylase [Sistotremastrum suecicum HHB10207 ss-3]